MQLFAAVHTARRQRRHRPGPRHVLFLPHHTQTDPFFTEKGGDILKFSPFVHESSGTRHSKQDCRLLRLHSLTSLVQEQIKGTR